MKKILAITLVFSISLGLSNNANAQQLPGATEIISMFSALKAKICEKGELLAGKFTLRSFSGALCLVPAIAKVALMLCANKGCNAAGKECFNESGCAANARANAGAADKTQVNNLITKSGLDIPLF